MTRDAFELVALSSRYIFTALMLLIVLRAIRGALVDSRRAATLRRLSPMTGLSGELVVLEANQKIPRGMRYPVIREGMIGSSRHADIRIRHASIRRRHALFELTDAGLHIRTHAGAKLRDGHGKPFRDLTLLDGDSLFVGAIRLHLVLSVPDMPVRPAQTDSDTDQDDDLFTAVRSLDPNPVSPLFETASDPFDDAPLYTRPRGQRVPPNRRPSRRAPNPNPVSPIFEEDDPYDRTFDDSRGETRRKFADDGDDLFSTDDKN